MLLSAVDYKLLLISITFNLDEVMLY